MKLRVFLSTVAAFVAMYVAAQGGSATSLLYADFSSQASFDQFTVINANGDTGEFDDDGTGQTVTRDVTWYFDTFRYCASYEYNKTDRSIGADDWLVTPALQLEGGRTYTLVFLAGCANSDGERLEVKLGSSPTAAGLTQTIMPATNITDKLNFSDLQGKVYTFDKVSVATSGTYYIGFHAISPADRFRLMLDNISITANPFTTAPAAVSNLKVTPAEKGGETATITFTAPSKDLEGNTLSSLTKIEILRGSTVIKTINNPAPGSNQTYVDELPLPGNNTYTVIAYNASGFGDAVSATVYVGLDVPERPYGAVATDNRTSVDLIWSPVGSVGANGGYVDPAAVSYIVYSVEGGYVVDELATTTAGKTSATIAMDTEAGAQGLTQFAIVAQNATGRSANGSAALVTGQSYRLPFEEHFANGETQNYWFRQSLPGMTPAFDAATSSDGDMSSYELTSSQPSEVRFVSGKINLSGSVNPTLTFDHLGQPGTNSSLIVEIQKPDGSVETLTTIDYSKQSGASAWKAESQLLKKYVNERYILVGFHFVAGAANQALHLDNIRVVDINDYDLSVSLQVPGITTKGETAVVGVVVKNEGGEAASDYRVRLLADKQEVFNELVSEPLEAQTSRTFEVEVPVSPTVTGSTISLHAFVEFDYDFDEDNNEVFGSLGVKESNLPTVENLQGTQSETAITLTWDQPSSLTREVTESFEGDEFPNFANGGITASVKDGKLGDWRTYDGDGKETYRISSSILFDTEGLQQAWYVVEPALFIDLSNNQRVRPHSGDRYLVSPDADGSSSNDWLISPRLSGEAQTISFWVSEWSASFNPEKFEVYYSTSGPNVSNMTYLGEGSVTEEKWVEQSYDLPSGARYFAIRHTTTDGWMLMLDDVTYHIGAGSIKEYNIYRDGELIATVDGDAALTYVDETTSGHVYHVTVVYSDGSESDAVRVVVGEVDAIDAVQAAQGRQAIGIYDLQGRQITGTPTAKGIYIINGRKVVVK